MITLINRVDLSEVLIFVYVYKYQHHLVTINTWYLVPGIIGDDAIVIMAVYCSSCEPAGRMEHGETARDSCYGTISMVNHGAFHG